MPVRHFLKKEKKLAERSFDLRTSGLWAQHASTAPLCSYVKYTAQKVNQIKSSGFKKSPIDVLAG